MQTEIIKVGRDEKDVDAVLVAAERLGEESGLSKKENLHLRLLTEELLGLLRGIAGDVEANWQAECEGKSFRLKLVSDFHMTQEVRMDLIETSTSGKNEAAKGFMGRLRNTIEAMMAGLDSPAVGQSGSLLIMGGPGVYSSGDGTWSLNQYRDAVGQSEGPDARAAWDVMEKSIVANLADDVKVHIERSHVEITIYKDF